MAGSSLGGGGPVVVVVGGSVTGGAVAAGALPASAASPDGRMPRAAFVALAADVEEGAAVVDVALAGAVLVATDVGAAIVVAAPASGAPSVCTTSRPAVRMPPATTSA